MTHASGDNSGDDPPLLTHCFVTVHYKVTYTSISVLPLGNQINGLGTDRLYMYMYITMYLTISGQTAQRDRSFTLCSPTDSGDPKMNSPLRCTLLSHSK